MYNILCTCPFFLGDSLCALSFSFLPFKGGNSWGCIGGQRKFTDIGFGSSIVFTRWDTPIWFLFFKWFSFKCTYNHVCPLLGPNSKYPKHHIHISFNYAALCEGKYTFQKKKKWKEENNDTKYIVPCLFQRIGSLTQHACDVPLLFLPPTLFAFICAHGVLNHLPLSPHVRQPLLMLRMRKSKLVKSNEPC